MTPKDRAALGAVFVSANRGRVPRRPRPTPELCRTWIATVKYHDDPAGHRTITTSIHGPNPTEAERRYCAEHPTVAAIIIRQESRS